MKIIINENERGYLFKNGTFVKLLLPGKYNFIAKLGYTVTSMSTNSTVDTLGIDISIFMRDKNFADSITRVIVPDNKIAIHYVDGRINSILQSGDYAYWNIFKKNTFDIIDISKPDAAADFDKSLFRYLPAKLYTTVNIAEGEVGLLYFDSKFERELQSGIYYFWNNSTKVTCNIVDIRNQQLDISGQEILTTDKVSLRINCVCNYRIMNPLKLLSSIKDYKTQIYILTQLALREYIGKYKFDEILEQKDSISNSVLNKLKEREAEYFIEFIDIGIKDIILPGEIRDIMNTVLIAEKSAQANVISRREEVASTRSLLNTAKLMEENKTLYKLKELEYLEKICDKVGNISVSGGNNLLEQLNELICKKNA